MGSGWRRAFCTTIPRGKEAISTEKQSQISETASPGPLKSCAKLRLFSSNPSTPRLSSKQSKAPTLRCRSSSAPEPQSADNTPRLHCKTSQKKPKSPRRKMASAPTSPRSPFSVFKTTLRTSKNGCGVCLQTVKAGNGTAIYTAECSHSFHFPCIAQQVRRQGSMVCPVCSLAWKEVPLFSAQKIINEFSDKEDVVEKTITTTTIAASANEPSNPTGGAHRILLEDKRIQSSISAVKTKHDRSEPSIDTIRPFNDDEPLLSPTAGARFNPIPEADEENEESGGGDEEFKGFFVNSTPSTATKTAAANAFSADRRARRTVELKLLPEAAVISAGRSHETFTVSLRVKAPPPPPPSSASGDNSPHRAPIDLVTVLDMGGSMNGAKLHMLKRAMRLVISSLASSDRLSIVAFSSTPQRLLPLRRMTSQGQHLARRIVDELSAGEGKSVTTALKFAGKVLEDRREKNPVASIILLSDGQEESSETANENSRQPRSHVSSARFGHIEIPVQSYGYGGDSVADAFAKRVGGLLSVVVQDLRLQLGFSTGSAPGEITAVYSCNGRPRSLGGDSIRLGDLYAEEERELLLELRVLSSAAGPHHVMSVRCSYRDPATGEVMYGSERALLVPRPHAVRSSDPRIERLRNLFVATRAVAETRRLVEHGEFGSAQKLLVSARTLVAQSSSASADEYGRWLDGELAELQWRKSYQVQQREQQLLAELQRRRQQQEPMVDENGEPLTPTSAWRAAERLAKVAMMKKSLNKSTDLHGFENARF
ncbi:hypothetical protein V2J09_018121 [Rumex salicifolius]